MHELGFGAEGPSGPALRAELELSSHQLTALLRRAEFAVELLPNSDTAAWHGPANWAYQVSLALLRRQAGAALELLRSSAQLTAAAAFEVDQRG